MQTRFPCHVQILGDQPQSITTQNALEVVYFIANQPPANVSVTFEFAPGRSVKILCDLQEGPPVDTEELHADYTGIKNSYSFQTEPIEAAMPVIAKLKLLEWLTELGDTRINTIIQKQLTAITEEDIHATYKALVTTHAHTFFSKLSATHEVVRAVLIEKGVDNINSLNAVAGIQDAIQSRLQDKLQINPPKPSIG